MAAAADELIFPDRHPEMVLAPRSEVGFGPDQMLQGR
jgi:hypothetical protein